MPIVIAIAMPCRCTQHEHTHATVHHSFRPIAFSASPSLAQSFCHDENRCLIRIVLMSTKRAQMQREWVSEWLRTTKFSIPFLLPLFWVVVVVILVDVCRHFSWWLLKLHIMNLNMHTIVRTHHTHIVADRWRKGAKRERWYRVHGSRGRWRETEATRTYTQSVRFYATHHSPIELMCWCE